MVLKSVSSRLESEQIAFTPQAPGLKLLCG
jgi:hypothetical protein